MAALRAVASGSGQRFLPAAFTAQAYSTTAVSLQKSSSPSATIPATATATSSASAASSSSSSSSTSSPATGSASLLPWLDRPLGVTYKPSPKPNQQTPKERAEYYLAKGRLEERKRIIANAAKGYWADFHDFRRNGGKSWRAPSTMIRSNKALYFPRIEGTCLKDRSTLNTVELCDGKVSIVCLLNTGISVEHTKTFYEPAVQAYSQNSDFQLVQLNLQPNLMKHYLISLFLSSVRKQIPESQHATYLLSKLDLDSPTSRVDSIHREDLNVHNIYVGYTYLVDQNGKIRWAGSGFAEPEERRSLVALTGQLLGEAPKAM